MRLYLIRHPRPDIATGVCYGRSDLCVPEHERAQAFSNLLPALPSGAPVFSSPLQRCMTLAEQIAAALRAGAVVQEARLIELDFGNWERQPWHAIPRIEIDAWASDPVRYRPGGGESVLEAAVRVHAFLHALQQAGRPQAILVCHAGPIRLLQAMREGASAEEAAVAAASSAHTPACGTMTVLNLD